MTNTVKATALFRLSSSPGAEGASADGGQYEEAKHPDLAVLRFL